MSNLNLELLKAHLFETLEGIKNQNDPDASQCEKVSIEQAKAIVDVADSIIDIYKTQIDAVRTVSALDIINKPSSVLATLGVTNPEDARLLQ